MLWCFVFTLIYFCSQTANRGDHSKVQTSAGVVCFFNILCSSDIFCMFCTYLQDCASDLLLLLCNIYL